MRALPEAARFIAPILCAAAVACGSGTTAEPAASVPCGATAPSAADVVVSTLAGNGKGAFADGTGGPAGTASFLNPNGVAVDPSGLVYVADYGNNRIRKVDLQGNVTTFAGGAGGDLDGPGANAQFYRPYGLALDKAGNLLVADSGTNRIRRVDPQGNVTTLAGNGAVGSTDGQGGRDGLASFAHPFGVAVDPSGNVLVADRYNNRIRRIDKTGAVTTLAGTGTMGFRDGPAGQAWFGEPTAITTDADGNVYVADQLNNRIRRIDVFGNVITLAGNGSAGYYDGSGGAEGCAQFQGPLSLAFVAPSTLYVADAFNNKLRSINLSTLRVSTVAGTGTLGFADGPGAVAEFSVPSRIAVNAAGSLLVTDNGNSRVRVVKPAVH